MAIKVNGTTVIDNSRNASLRFINAGAYTKAQLQSNTITGSEGSFTYCTDLGKIVFWIGSSWEV